MSQMKKESKGTKCVKMQKNKNSSNTKSRELLQRDVIARDCNPRIKGRSPIRVCVAAVIAGSMRMIMQLIFSLVLFSCLLEVISFYDCIEVSSTKGVQIFMIVIRA